MTKRKCLKCKKEFNSEWVGNRICPPCKVLNKGVVEHGHYGIAGISQVPTGRGSK